jgi:ribosomal protein S18 acetylase RimI-like enzyme
MTTIRTAKEGELPAIQAFDAEYVGGDRSLDDLRAMFATHPNLFVVAHDGGQLVAIAYGRETRDEESPTSTVDGASEVSLLSIGVRKEARGEGHGRTVLDHFERQAAERWDIVGAAAANNVEWFYRECGYEPALLLVQVAESDLPVDYADADRLVGERVPEPGTRFLYAEFESYSTDLRDRVAERFNAFEINTIFRKHLPE